MVYDLALAARGLPIARKVEAFYRGLTRQPGFIVHCDLEKGSALRPV